MTRWSDRRTGERGDTGERRRAVDISERREEFRLLRDKILLTLGVCGVLGITLSAVLFGVKDLTLALAALTLFGGLLGAPTVLRLDEHRQEDRREAPRPH